MKLSHRLRWYLLNRQADALLRKACQPSNDDFEPIPDFSFTPTCWLLIAMAVGFMFVLNF